ncbi:MAG: 2-hydroxyacyl-CoA dehydratase subunit D, partial [Ruminococcus sp.]
EIFGNHIYKLTQTNPQRALKELSFVFTTAGLQCKYFPTKLLLPARQYMQWAAADSAIKPLKKADSSAIVSLYLPCEILHAMGIYQLFPEALSCYLAAAGSEKIFIETAENNGIPKTLCSYHKTFIGMAESGVLPKPKFVINTSLACDVNHLSFRRIADYYGVPHFMIDVPYQYNESNLDYVEKQLHQMVDFIEQNSDFRLDEGKFKEVIGRSKNTINNFNRILELKKDRYLSDEMTSQMLSIFATHVMLGTKEAEKYSRDMISQLSKCPKEHKGVRLLWVHTLPYTQDALRNIINFTDRCEIVACDMVFDALDVDTNEENPYRFIADRLLRNTVNGSRDNRINAVLKYARELNCDGVVWYCHWGCKQTAGSSARAKEVLEENGFPTLVLDGDGCNNQNVNDGQTVTRMEAFLELLENRK